ncbi:hypothetical protein O9G_004276 [Rozella allomycis CSF55]|uniref:Uncharacterized protein n=1 Tax=Rozella allomycis (strain CSF55) TaxID=988480 RepID=A0A075API3_ROZAC|nr:hypothetical protein O9G_004276 [Rozella allomycis CSF55]|eukprot:EPZ32011.1 hypothetical protein O9G_004276 [Rozella allomycis CSF55]
MNRNKKIIPHLRPYSKDESAIERFFPIFVLRSKIGGAYHPRFGPLGDSFEHLPASIEDLLIVPNQLGKAIDKPFVKRALRADHLKSINARLMILVEEEQERVKYYQGILEKLGNANSQQDMDLKEIIIKQMFASEEYINQIHKVRAKNTRAYNANLIKKHSNK